jgi:tryptophan-rich sensory protein
MKKTVWTYVGWIAVTEAVGALAGFLTRNSTELYQNAIVQPPLSPPALVFPVVWALLYALMGISAAISYLSPPSEQRCSSLELYVLQLTVNFFWSILFFRLQAFGGALIWLIVLRALILWMIFSFRKVSPLAAKLQIPYLLWVTFAGYLNAGVWLLNGG